MEKVTFKTIYKSKEKAPLMFAETLEELFKDRQDIIAEIIHDENYLIQSVRIIAHKDFFTEEISALLELAKSFKLNLAIGRGSGANRILFT